MIYRSRYMGILDPLPAGYSAASYIESVGNVILLTNIKVRSGVSLKVDFHLFDNDKSLPTLISFRTGYSAHPIWIRRESVNFVITFGNITYSTPWDENRHTITISEKKVWFDDAMVIDGSAVAEFNPDGSRYGITLLGRRSSNQNTNESNGYSLARIYELTIDEHPLIPCMRKTNQQYGLYDTATGTFFGNANLTGQLK